MTSSTALEIAEGLRRSREYARALEAYQALLVETETPSAPVCLGLARCYQGLDADSEALAWLARVVDSGQDYRHWQAAARLMDKAVQRLGPAVKGVKRTARLWLTGSSTLVQLTPLLRLAALRAGVLVVVGEGAYGQYRQDILDPASPLYQFDPDFVLTLVDHEELAFPAYAETPDEFVASTADSMAALWDIVSSRTRARLIASNIAIPLEEPFGHLAARLPGTRRSMLQSLNGRLAALASERGIALLDADALSSEIGKRSWFDSRFWHLSKQAVSFDALPALARRLAALIAAELGLAKKCLVLDLDNTLWGGVVGEDGVAGIKIGPGDPRSEAYSAFQSYVKGLQAKGVVLAVCSKNDEAAAREPFETRPEMILKLEDFATFVANWETKPENLSHIAKVLNIGMDSLVFVDDNPAEREIVRQFAPDVDVVPMPSEPSDYVRALSDYLGFETVVFTKEDQQKTAQYRAKAEIARLESSATSIDDFHRSLQMRAVIAPFDDRHIARIVQLIGKTNQFNLTTPRLSEAEVRALMAAPGAAHFYLKLRDRFADHGLVSLIMGRPLGDALDIHLWLMSCRVIGRTVETQLLATMSEAALERGLKRLRGTFVPTAKNSMVSQVYPAMGFALEETLADGVSVWSYDVSALGPIRGGRMDVETRAYATVEGADS